MIRYSRRMRLVTLSLLMIMVVAMLFGCTRGGQQKPLPEERPDQTRVKHDKKYKEEPTITLYVNETKEKKKIKLEEYLTAVVAAEMEPTWPTEALAAQAILARTFTLENIEAGRVKKLHGTDASTSVEEFQAYDPTRINDKVKQAVERTRGEVVTHKGKYIKAWFHACDGGKSATAKEGLAYTKTPTPYVKVVEDGCMDITTPENKSWTVKFSKAEVREAVRKFVGKDPGDFQSVTIAEKGPSGRAMTVKLGESSISGPALRLALGSDKVRSMMLTDLRLEGGQLIFKGQGFGHGVGMCQWGANDFAKKGKSPEEIVSHYFKDVEVVKLWD